MKLIIVIEEWSNWVYRISFWLECQSVQFDSSTWSILCGSFLVSWLRRCNMKGHVLPMITTLATGQTQTFLCRVHNSRHQATTIRISFKMKNLSRLFHSCPQVSTVYSWLVIQEVIQWKGVQTTSQLSLAWQQHNIIHQEKVNNDDVSLSINSWQNKEFIILLICKSL